MSSKKIARTKTPTKRAPKPATKKPKTNGAADPTADLGTLTALVNDLNAKLKTNGVENLRVGFLTKITPPERDPSRNIDGQLMVNTNAERAMLKIEADPPTDNVTYQPIGDLIARTLCAGFVTYEPTHPAHWTTLEGGLLRVTELELRALAIALEHESADKDATEVTFGADDATRMLIALSHRLEAGAELANRMREARWGDPRFGGFDLAKAKRAAGEDTAEESSEVAT